MPSFRFHLENRLFQVRQAIWRLRNRAAVRRSWPGRTPGGIVLAIAPPSIGQHRIGQELLTGTYTLAGQTVAARAGQSLWLLDAPDTAFDLAAHGFDWLDDLAALGDAAARRLAQDWLLDWIRLNRRGRGMGWRADVTGRRMTRIVTHADFLLRGLPDRQVRQVMRALGVQTRFLVRRWWSVAPGRSRTEALCGLIHAAAGLEGMSALLPGALDALGRDCASHVASDGGLPARNPEELMETFVLLTWVARCLEQAGVPPDPRVQGAMARMASALRVLRLGDGGLVRFHGGGRGAEGRLDQALADARVKDTARGHAAMGYLRLSAGRLAVVLDAAAPAFGIAGSNGDGNGGGLAHASTLGFEMSSGRRPFVISVGPGARLGPDWARACRETAAHSALVVERLSSARLVGGSAGTGARIAAGPAQVRASRAQDLTGVWLAASHDGYRASHGLIHERRMFLTIDGRELRGEDRLFPVGATADRAEMAPPPDPAGQAPAEGLAYTAHFHLHPDVAVRDCDGQTATLTLLSGETWVFSQTGGLAMVEDSVYLDRAQPMPVATRQIVVMARALSRAGRIEWAFRRTADGGRHTRDITPDLVPQDQPGT